MTAMTFSGTDRGVEFVVHHKKGVWKYSINKKGLVNSRTTITQSALRSSTSIGCCSTLRVRGEESVPTRGVAAGTEAPDLAAVPRA